MTTVTSKPERKQYTILNAAYYHGSNIKIVLDIVLRGLAIVGGVVGIVALVQHVVVG